MPGFDRMGPMSAGPMTGGRRGFCNPATTGTLSPPYAGGYAYGRGLGLRRGFRGGNGPGMGRGYGRGYGWYPPAAGPVLPLNAPNEVDMLKAEAEYMQRSLDAINKRLDELAEKPSEAS